ncbi:hypothetical protein Tco_1015257 [Tanacetum coccineum]|uniref:Uncharacterized protein n=1 Tax=Tanacetum coccineum TaxID=301880 RepID=A0ABQ5FM51_9ASTR
MAESSNPRQTPPQQESSSQHDQAAKPKTSIPYDTVLIFDYDPDQINFKTNNEVAFLYPDHPNKKHFKVVPVFISKCCLRDVFTRTPTQYKEYLVEFLYTAKVLKKNLPKAPPFTDHMLAIYNENEHVAFKAPSTSSKTEKKSGTDKDLNPSQSPASTPMVARIHKEFQQATSGPTSLRVTGEEKANPQISSVVSASSSNHVYSESTILHSESASRHDTSAASIAEADLEKSTPNDSLSKKQGIDKGTKKYSFDYIIAGTKKDVSKAEREANFDQDEFNTSPNLSSSDDATKQIKLEDFSKLEEEIHTELNKLKLEIPAGLLALLGQVSSIQVQLSKLKTLNALLILLHRVTEALDKFAQAIESTSNKTGDHGVLSASPSYLAKGEKNT